METQSPIQLSIVATIYNDDAIVPLLVNEIIKNVEPLRINYEIILVNDCSTDKSDEYIKLECAKNTNVKGITLRRNFGQQIAMSVGIKHAKGNFIIIMDGDLQNTPEAIPVLYNEIIKGFDIVYTVSSKRNDFIDEITSQFFWFVLIKLFKVNMIRNQLMLKIFTKEFAEIFSLYYERNRTIGGLAFDISSNYHIIEVDNRKRTIGRSHYNFFKRFNIMIDMVINLSNTPVNMMIHLGWITFTGTLIVSFYELYSYFFRQVPSGYTSLILSIFFFGSLIVMLLGIIGRYLSNINLEVKQRPLFHIKSKYNL